MSLRPEQCIHMWYRHRRQASELWSACCHASSSGKVTAGVQETSVERCVQPIIGMHHTQMKFWSELLERRGWYFDLARDRWLLRPGDNNAVL